MIMDPPAASPAQSSDQRHSPSSSSLPGRDPLADADASLIRKRPRLSHEQETPPTVNDEPFTQFTMSDSRSDSAQSPTVVEIPQERFTDPSEVSIIIPDDETPDCRRIETFPFISDVYNTPEASAKALAEALSSKKEPMSDECVTGLSDWLERHLRATQVDFTAALQQHSASNTADIHPLYSDHAEFWNHIVACFQGLAGRSALNDASQLRGSVGFACFDQLLHGFLQLGERLLHTEVAILAQTAARRDSTRPIDPPKHSLLFASWAGAFSKLVILQDSFIKPFASRNHFNGASIRKSIILGFQDCALDAIVNLIRHIVTKPETIQSPFSAVHPYLLLCLETLSRETGIENVHLQALYAKSMDLFKLSRTMIVNLLPKIHLDNVSQRLVGDVAVFLIETAEHLLLSGHLTQSSAFELVLKEGVEYRASSADLISPSMADQIPTPESTEQNMDLEDALIQQITVSVVHACKLEYFNALIRSSSVEMRVHGIENLGHSALEIWQKHSPAMKEYTSKFLQAKAIVPYLFGPQSHGALIARSFHTVGFLVVTNTMTKTDADALWNTFVNHQQSDISQGAFLTLQRLLHPMHPPQVMYFLNKYRYLQPSQFTRRAETFFNDLLARLPKDLSGTFEVACICISLLEQAGRPEVTYEIQDHRITVLKSILATIPSLEDVEEQTELVERCAGPIKSYSDAATGCIQALFCILHLQSKPLVPTQEILSRLSFAQSAEELINFIQRTKESDKDLAATTLVCRIDLTLYLLSISDSDADDSMQKRVWDCLVGTDSISPSSRQIAWSVMASHLRDMMPGLQGFYQRCILQYLPALSPDLVVPNTYSLFSIEDHLQAANPEALLPLESELIKFTISCPADVTSNHFATVLLDHLFQRKALANPALAVEKQVGFVRECVSKLSLQNVSSLKAASLLQYVLANSTNFEKTTGLDKKNYADDGNKQTPELAPELAPESIQIPIRVHKGNTQPQSRVVVVNKSASCSELDAAIASETGFNSYTVIAAGQRINFDAAPEQPIENLGLQGGNTLIIQKHNTLRSIQDDVNRNIGRTAVERELLSHLNVLYNALDKPTATGEEVFQVLLHMRIPGPARDLVASPETPFDAIFPPTKPLRLRMSIEVLYLQLQEQIAVGIADEQFLLRGVHLLIHLLERSEYLRDLQIVYRTAEVLLAMLRERPTKDEPEAYFKDARTFVNQTFAIISSIQQQLVETDYVSYRPHAICSLYLCLLEGVLLSSSVRAAFVAAENVAAIHQSLLMTSNRHLAEKMPQIVLNFIQDDNAPAEIKSFFCSMFIQRLIPAAQDQPRLCANIYYLATDVLFSDQSLTTDENALRSLIASFSSTLLSMKHLEAYGSGFVDLRIQGQTNLLRACVQGLKSLKTPLNLGNLAAKLFSKLLFPPAASNGDGNSSRPVVNPEARKRIYDLLRIMCEDFQMLAELSDLCEEACQCAEIPAEFTFPGLERYIRPEGGYAGLDNLAQTCYMNSLIQQLFMNIHFRKFIFDTPVVDSKRQAILHEFKIAFARMQDSHGITYRPETLAKALDVDVMQQDDAHIFFTTLIGKLEDSMPDDKAKKTLKSFFGGVNKIQTIGTCQHVSEALDEYFNLSLVVKDKTSLAESLEEYVQGAALEGGDKFKCTTCGSGEGIYVDAVRRTAFDDIPDNLVLGLKRFRYENLDGGAKVNDRFDFPERIDMSPYKLQRLAGVEKHSDPDVFQLVGVVVHQGTLQFGHYWSYAAERGHAEVDPLPWLRLEDAQVTRSDIDEVLQETRGGPPVTLTTSHYGQAPEPRTDNAYILFYQRMSSVKESVNCLVSNVPMMNPSFHPKVRLPEDLAMEITKENEQMIHTINLFSSDHLNFVRSLAIRLEELKKGKPEDRKTAEAKVLRSLYRCFADIVSRSPFTDLLEYTVQVLQKLACSSAHHTGSLLDVMFASQSPTKTNLILHKKPSVRQATARLILACLSNLRQVAPEEYGINAEGWVSEPEHTQIGRVIRGLTGLLNLLPDNRLAWPEFFELMGHIAESGLYETCLILDHRLLEWCLELFYVKDDGGLRKKHPRLAFHLSNNRKYSFASVVDCVHSLLHKYVDLLGQTSEHKESQKLRMTGLGTLLLTPYEYRLLGLWYTATDSNCIMDYCLMNIQYDGSTSDKLGVCKLAVLLTDMSKTPREICESVYTAIQMNLENASSANYVPEVAAMCLINQKMENRASKGILHAILSIVSDRSMSDKSSLAQSMLWVVSKVWESQPSVVLQHMAQILGRLLVCDNVTAEEETAQWLRDRLLDLEPLRKPYISAALEPLHQRVAVVKDLVVFLGRELERAVSNNIKSDVYAAAVEAFLNCEDFLTQVSQALETEVETRLSGEESPEDARPENEKATQELVEELTNAQVALNTSQQINRKIGNWMNQATGFMLCQSREVVEEETDLEAGDMDSDGILSEFEETIPSPPMSER